MEANVFPRNTYLDVIFQGRNQAYGAYQLRISYPRRMRMAAIALFAISALIAASTLVSSSSKVLPAVHTQELVVSTFDYKEQKIKQPEIIKPPKVETVHIKTEVFSKPDIVKDPDPARSLASQESLRNAVAGVSRGEGEGDISIASQRSGPGNEGEAIITEGVKKGFEETFKVVEQDPRFPGGEEALQRFLAENIRYPEQAKNARQQGRVVLRFVVGKDGSIESVSIKRGFGFGSEEEAMRVLNLMPKWIPGKNNGVEVRCWMQLPINFLLED
ncbi:TonB family protein [Rurimicrobium arvi]|uniref:Energy transducer TonB n=1 Tax=Rurimicrobium arvi TaxID=2049916 RepID=A0ABP8MEP5_9BACT